jgi:glycolate oxidase iron-sulfur subunit
MAKKKNSKKAEKIQNATEPSVNASPAAPQDVIKISGDVGNATISADLLAACIHCGLCLPACPTYLATGRETESPRGRIYLMSLWQQGKLPLNERVVEHLESCLGCLGCQTACPSGVQYEAILNQARPAIAEKRSRQSRAFGRFIFAKVLPDYALLQRLGGLLRLWQKTGYDKALNVVPWLKKALGKLDQWQSFLPKIPEFKPLPKQSWTSGKKLGSVQFFSGCVMDVFYNQVNHAAVRLLALTRQIVYVPEQTCCGALAFHAGEVDIARDLAKRNIENFEKQEGKIVVSAAGCGAMLKMLPELFADDAEWKERAEAFSARVADLTEFLADAEFARKPKSLDKKVTYHAACHLCHAQKVFDAPKKLLSSLEGVDLIPLTEAEHCCGSAGIFNLTHTELSKTVLDRKIDYLKETGADIVVTTNPGCLLQIDYGLKGKDVPMKVMHLAELLDEAYSEE